MAWSLDARTPVTLLPDLATFAAALRAGPPAAALLPAPATSPPAGAVSIETFDAAEPTHVAGCACCAGRSAAASALDRLFQGRVRNACPWFDRVLALADSPAADAALRDALARDPLAAARFRLG